MKEKKHKCIICGNMTAQYYFVELDIFEGMNPGYKPSICNFSSFCNIQKLDIYEIYQRREFLKIFRNSIKNNIDPSNIWISGFCEFERIYNEIKNGEYGEPMLDWIKKEEKKLEEK